MIQGSTAATAARVVVLLTAALVYGSCGAGPTTLDAIQSATVPPGVVSPNPTREQSEWSIRLTWSFNTEMSAAQYLTWVEGRLTRQRFSVRRTALGIEAIRQDVGDVYLLEIAASAEPPTLVRVNLVARPD